ncbi:putative glycoside hydrolase [Staphylococcus warneri]|uniref:GTP-binding protein n=1 Tax=Staphylococcus warneri TaxID=1292 RepID=A0A8B2ZL77_STAWA|nr:putative glycoside hydrolase [Staphylococcus warneri]KKI60672.1 putative glycoside hydrolase [Staphylococcus warneri]MCK6088810.1 putative glycoside hydrolase [Staphylococcus warneri]MCK6167118.1 putative glycoside hydrolase [Staphylococcus warneri]MCK6176835.1 putative glycoside hydrolase [Staphylococcus warneri]MCK6244999.1 putative glycoside hydrolase [Staphylococcus warneri]
MKQKKIWITLAASALIITGCSSGHENDKSKDNKAEQTANQRNKVAYPKDGVKGIYVTSNSTQGDKIDQLIKYVKDAKLNAMVIDVKDDEGNVTMKFNTGNKLIDKNTMDIADAKPLLKKLKDNDIYPIARIVTFKDTKLAKEHPEWSYKEKDGSVWQNGKGDSFVNPFVKDVWKYNVSISKEAAKAGFQDIQYDYVRFPEGFENEADQLDYDKGDYKNSKLSKGDQRVDAVTSYLEYARKELKPYNVKISAAVFGYSALVKNAPGIGQSFPKISKNVDAISSMIYPSHWSPGDFGLEAPDTEPYKTVNRYIQKENNILDSLGKQKPISRPWIQDFTASYLGEGNYKEYDAKALSDQVQALKDNGVNEFLLWNAGNDYTKGANFNPEKGKNQDKDYQKEKKDK